MAEADACTGALTEADYMPDGRTARGRRSAASSGFHFGNFGGAGVRWAYFLLGLAGAFLFYIGNLLWMKSRRKRERKRGAFEQTRSTRVLGALTVGVPLSCIAGIAATVAAAKPLGLAATPAPHSGIYFAVFWLSPAGRCCAAPRVQRWNCCRPPPQCFTFSRSRMSSRLSMQLPAGGCGHRLPLAFNSAPSPKHAARQHLAVRASYAADAEPQPERA